MNQHQIENDPETFTEFIQFLMENYFDQLSAMNGAYIPNDDRDYPSLDKGDGLTKRFP